MSPMARTISVGVLVGILTAAIVSSIGYNWTRLDTTQEMVRDNQRDIAVIKEVIVSLRAMAAKAESFPVDVERKLETMHSLMREMSTKVTRIETKLEGR